jgi:hypothetical protein
MLFGEIVSVYCENHTETCYIFYQDLLAENEYVTKMAWAYLENEEKQNPKEGSGHETKNKMHKRKTTKKMGGN